MRSSKINSLDILTALSRQESVNAHIFTREKQPLKTPKQLVCEAIQDVEINLMGIKHLLSSEEIESLQQAIERIKRDKGC